MTIVGFVAWFALLLIQPRLRARRPDLARWVNPALLLLLTARGVAHWTLDGTAERVMDVGVFGALVYFVVVALRWKPAAVVEG